MANDDDLITPDRTKTQARSQITIDPLKETDAIKRERAVRDIEKSGDNSLVLFAALAVVLMVGALFYNYSTQSVDSTLPKAQTLVNGTPTITTNTTNATNATNAATTNQAQSPAANR